MQIKRFEARSMSEALQRVKAELGPDAVILSARSLQRGRGILAKIRGTGVEVTAAIDARPAVTERAGRYGTGAFNTHSSDPSYHKHMVSRRRQHLLRSYGGNIQEDRRSTASGHRSNNQRSISPSTDDVYRQLILQGVKKEYASEIVANIPRSYPQVDTARITSNVASLAAALKATGIVAKPLPIRAKTKHIIALIGSPGVGKTSTLAKLAAHYSVNTDKTVGCIAMDNYRVAGTAQLKTYAHILGLPVAEAVNRKQLNAALKEFKDHDLIFIDTPAINRRDDASTRLISKWLAKNPAIEPILLVDATAREEEQFDLLDRIKHLSVKRVIITKADESIHMGAAVNLLIRSGLHWSYATAGRQVMGHLTEASCSALAGALLSEKDRVGRQKDVRRRFMRKSNPAAAKRPSDPATLVGYFVANRNSDVFHSPDCKWTKLIKEDHIVVFENTADAEKKRFKPCRYCCPSKPESIHGDAWNQRMKRAVGYR